MRRLLIAFALVASPTITRGWNGPDHQAIGRIALQEVAREWGLDRPVPVRPLESLLKKLLLCMDSSSMGIVRGRAGSPPDFSEPSGCASGERIDPWHFADWLKINPAIDIERPVPEMTSKKAATPLEILSYYSIDPDDGRDQDLFVRDEKGKPHARFRDQKWFGALAGANSQAFRHMEKPPFSFRHPIATFGFPFRGVGEATRRCKIWCLASELAFAHGEEYWGWRFLANALHYLQDLHQPFHAGQITPGILIRGLGAWPFGWGYSKGFMGTFAQLMSNTHRFFESFIAQPGSRDQGKKDRALFALRGKETPPLPDDPLQLAIAARDASNRLFPPTVNAVIRMAKPELLGGREFRSDPPAADDPLSFIREGTDAANRRLYAIVNERFGAAGQSLRTAVRMAINRRGTRTPEQITQELTETISGHSP